MKFKRNIALFWSMSESLFPYMILVVLMTFSMIFLDISRKQLIFFSILIYTIYSILEIIFTCKSYLFKCYRRKMMLLRNKNQRLFNKVHDDDLKIVRARFPRTKSFKLYTITVSISRYLPCKFFIEVRKKKTFF
jgi:hypothetical protein